MRTEDLRGGDSSDCVWDSVVMPAVHSAAPNTYERLMAGDAYEKMVRTMERDIVPRLMLVRREPAPARSTRRDSTALPGEEQVEEFVRLLMSRDASLSAAFIETLRQRGIQPLALCLHVLAPAAARLGTLWEEDACTFMQVTLGLCRLHQLLHGVCAQTVLDPADELAAGSARALIVGLPGEQHTFGAMIAGHLLRRAGWDVWNEFPSCTDEILQTVNRLSFRVIGISVGSDRRLEDLQPLVGAIRRQSRCRNASVVLGGAMVFRQPSLAREVGADAAPVGADEMLQWAEAQLASRRRVAREG